METFQMRTMDNGHQTCVGNAILGDVVENKVFLHSWSLSNEYTNRGLSDRVREWQNEIEGQVESVTGDIEG